CAVRPRRHAERGRQRSEVKAGIRRCDGQEGHRISGRQESRVRPRHWCGRHDRRQGKQRRTEGQGPDGRSRGHAGHSRTGRLVKTIEIETATTAAKPKDKAPDKTAAKPKDDPADKPKDKAKFEVRGPKAKITKIDMEKGVISILTDDGKKL